MFYNIAHTARTSVYDLGGDSTFRGRPFGTRAWSRGGGDDSDSGRRARPPSNYGDVSPGGIRAESRYVYPDGSVRCRLETGRGSSREGKNNEGENRDPGVPMPLVGTSRIGSADLSSSAVGINVLQGGVSRTRVDDNDDGGNEASDRRRRGNGDDSNAYRGPGTVPGAGFAPGGRRPRPFVPFLNLPRSDARRSGRREHQQETIVNRDSPTPTSPIGGLRRGPPLAGVGGVLVSAGRAMLTGPGRPGTGMSASSSRIFGDTSRARDRQCSSGGGDEETDGGDSDGSGSTDVGFLQRRATAKLRSLERREAAQAESAGGEETRSIHSSVSGDGRGVEEGASGTASYNWRRRRERVI